MAYDLDEALKDWARFSKEVSAVSDKLLGREKNLQKRYERIHTVYEELVLRISALESQQWRGEQWKDFVKDPEVKTLYDEAQSIIVDTVREYTSFQRELGHVWPQLQAFQEKCSAAAKASQKAKGNPQAKTARGAGGAVTSLNLWDGLLGKIEKQVKYFEDNDADKVLNWRKDKFLTHASGDLEELFKKRKKVAEARAHEQNMLLLDPRREIKLYNQVKVRLEEIKKLAADKEKPAKERQQDITAKAKEMEEISSRLGEAVSGFPKPKTDQMKASNDPEMQKNGKAAEQARDHHAKMVEMVNEAKAVKLQENQ
jgi:hypothetical protein